jgi:hypothetical protein
MNLPDGETTKRRIVRESLNTHRLGWNHLNDGSITRLDELGRSFDRLSSTTINLLEKFGELAGNVGSVAIKDRSITGANLTRVVKNDDLGVEGFSTLGWVVLGVTADVSTTDFLDGNVLDVEADVVTRKTLNELFVVHFDGLDFGGDTGWGEGDDHTGCRELELFQMQIVGKLTFDGTSFNTTDWHSSDTTNLVDVLKWKTEGLVNWT